MLQEGTLSLGSHAFIGCRSLKSVSIPKSVGVHGMENAPYDTFYDCHPSFSISCYKLSSAAAYAADLSVPFTLIDGGKSKMTLSFDVNGGTALAVSNTVVSHYQYYIYNNSYFPTPVRQGYKFDGWYTGRNGGSLVTGRERITATDDFTIYAHWTPTGETMPENKTYIVMLDTNGGKKLNPTTKTVIYDSAYGALPKPVKLYKKFVGWFTAKSGGTEITAGTIVKTASNHTLYAHWAALKGKATKKVKILSKANAKGKKVGTLKKGGQDIVIGTTGKYYQV
jgi:uncharacterized repeat protein (TIGR02543 family)